jgi:hypothetical protein
MLLALTRASLLRSVLLAYPPARLYAMSTSVGPSPSLQPTLISSSPAGLPSTTSLDARYRPFLTIKNASNEPDWVKELELETATSLLSSFE